MLLLVASASYAADLKIKIVRTSENLSSTTGELFVNGQFVAHTLELPWQNNQSYISSIPAGTYKAILRYDKNDRWRLQLLNVPGGRTGIQIHVGNHPGQIEGCLLVGDKVVNAENRLEGSGNAYARLRTAFYGTSTPVASPDVDVSIEIQFPPGRTQLRDAQGAVWLYDGSGKWLYGPEHLLNMEYQRDVKFIYIRYRGPHLYFRFPLFGGAHEYSSKRDGPWEPGESSVTRVN